MTEGFYTAEELERFRMEKLKVPADDKLRNRLKGFGKFEKTDPTLSFTDNSAIFKYHEPDTHPLTPNPVASKKIEIYTLDPKKAIYQLDSIVTHYPHTGETFKTKAKR